MGTVPPNHRYKRPPCFFCSFTRDGKTKDFYELRLQRSDGFHRLVTIRVHCLIQDMCKGGLRIDPGFLSSVDGAKGDGVVDNIDELIVGVERSIKAAMDREV